MSHERNCCSARRPSSKRTATAAEQAIKQGSIKQSKLLHCTQISMKQRLQEYTITSRGQKCCRRSRGYECLVFKVFAFSGKVMQVKVQAAGAASHCWSIEQGKQRTKLRKKLKISGRFSQGGRPLKIFANTILTQTKKKIFLGFIFYVEPPSMICIQISFPSHYVAYMCLVKSLSRFIQACFRAH